MSNEHTLYLDDGTVWPNPNDIKRQEQNMAGVYRWMVTSAASAESIIKQLRDARRQYKAWRKGYEAWLEGEVEP